MRRVTASSAWLAILAAIIAAGGCSEQERTSTREASESRGASKVTAPLSFSEVALDLAPTVTFIGAGDIAYCSKYHNWDEATAKIIDQYPDATVFTLGDNAYPDATAEDYANCYDPSWGRFKARTKPVPGNREYYSPGANGYFDYFGAAAGDPTKGYYSFDLGAWHIVVINDNVAFKPGTAQEIWLRQDLAAHPNKCILAMHHTPRFYNATAGGNRPAMKAFWTPLYDAGAEIILAGHYHYYERYAKQTPDGVLDPARGIRQFIVGSGGKSVGVPAYQQWNVEVQDLSETYGVLKLTLEPDAYSWEFIPIAGKTFTDSGRELCH